MILNRLNYLSGGEVESERERERAGEQREEESKNHLLHGPGEEMGPIQHGGERRHARLNDQPTDQSPDPLTWWVITADSPGGGRGDGSGTSWPRV